MLKKDLVVKLTILQRFQLLLRSLKAKLSFRPLVYGYANSRVHGMFSQFLTEAQFKEIMSAKSAQSLAGILERTPYKEDLVAYSLRFKGEQLIELALGRHYARFAKKVLSITPPAGQDTIKAILSRWDAHNLKTVILARKQKKTFEQLEPFLVLASTLTRTQLKSLFEAPSAEDLYSILRTTEFGSGLLSRPSLNGYNGNTPSASIKKMILSMGKDDTALEPLLAQLDVYSYSLATDVITSGEQDARQVATILAMIASEKNLSTVLRLLSANETPENIEKYIVPGGYYTKHEWVNIARLKDTDKILEKVSSKIKYMSSAKEEYEKTKKLSSIEVILSQQSAKEGLRQFRNSQLSLGVIVGALLMKEQEMANIRKITRAKALGLDDSEINKMIVMVK